jgi:hypothetical protein
VVRRFVIEELGDQPLRVGALDESGQEKQGESTAGAKRQYMGCAGRVANGVNTVYCSYVTPGGHALVGARIYVPEEQLADTEHRVALGIPAEVEFKTTSQLAQDSVALRETTAGWTGRVRVVTGVCPDHADLIALLIRPDGYIAFVDSAAATPDHAHLQADLTRWFGPA